MDVQRVGALRVESTLPPSWATEDDFHDALYEWMHRAPWLAISAAAHLVVFFILATIPWQHFRQKEERVIVSEFLPVHEEIPDDPIEERELEIEDVPVEEVPVVQDVEVAEVDVDAPLSDSDFDALDFEDLSLFEDVSPSGLIGIGPGSPVGKYGDRIGKGGGRPPGGSGTARAIESGLDWLARHQSKDGSWDSDGFGATCAGVGDPCDGAGDSLHDVGVTGLALLAFLGEGNTLSRGPHRTVVARGIRWLREQQDFETGLIGEELGHAFLYDHAIASLALCEAFYFSRSPMIETSAQKAVNYITRVRNPYGAWRYDVPPIGSNDTSVTGWMVFALTSAREAGLRVDEAAFTGSLTWLDEVTDPANGRVGYDSPGSRSSRVVGLNDHFPADRSEAMTAVGLLCRIFLGQTPSEHPILEKHARLLLTSLPEWDPAGEACDMYYWYYGTYAMYQMGGRYWKAWNAAMKKAVVESQRRDGDAEGSWDPVGPWGRTGGRVYSTALMTLSLEVYYRYARVLGGR